MGDAANLRSLLSMIWVTPWTIVSDLLGPAFTTTLTLTALLSPLAGPASARPGRSAEPLALVGGTVLVSPTDEPIPNGVVLIRAGRIEAVGPRSSVALPPGIETLDCSGATVAAGFWNSHVHFTERKWADAESIPGEELARQLRSMLTDWGFTSVFDTGSMWNNTRRLRARIESGEVPGPRIRSTGPVVFPKGGSAPPEIPDVLGTMRMPSPEVAGADEARVAAMTLLDAGTDGVKLYAATWYPPFVALSGPAIRAAVAEAHRRAKPVFAHPTSRDGLLAAVHAGVDVVVHTAPRSGPWDEAVLSAMKRAGAALVPTLKLWSYELRHDRISAKDNVVAAGVAQLRAWHAAGGTVLFGTDVGYMGDYDPSDEYALMAEAGMSARDILASLTTAPAERFGESTRLGRVMPGLVADLVVLDRDPTGDARAFAAVRYAIREGVVIHRGGERQ